MKRLYRWAADCGITGFWVVFSMAFSGWSSAQIPAEPIVRNGAFEQGGSTALAHWSGRPPGTWSCQTHAERPKDRYVLLQSEKGGETPLVLQRELPLEPGLEYTCAYDIQAPTKAAYRVYLEWWKTEGGYGGSVNTQWRQGTGFWERDSFRLRYPTSMSAPYIVLQVRGPGTAAFDNVRIYRPIPEQVRAGCVFSADFETGPAQWELPAGCEVRNGSTPSGLALLVLRSRAEGHNPAAVVSGIATKPGAAYSLTYRVCSGGGSAEITGFQHFRVSTAWGRLTQNGRDYGAVSQRDGLEWQDCFASWQRRTLKFRAPHKPTSGLILSCQVRGPGSVLIDDLELREVVDGVGEPPLELVITEPHYREMVFPGQSSGRIEGFAVPTDDVVKRVRIGLEGQDVSPVEHTRAAGDRLPFTLESGPATVCAEAFDAQGRSLGMLKRRVLAAAPLKPGARSVVLRRDGIPVLANGRAVFPIGLWRCPSEPRQLAEIAGAGFNVVRCTTDPEHFADLERAGLLGMVTVANDPPADAAGRQGWREQMVSRLEPLRSSQALLGYYLVDEPLWCGRPLQPLLDAYDFYRAEDPYHPVWINMAPRGTVADLARYNRACDISGADIYPVPEGGSHSELEDTTLACVGAYTRRMVASVADQKPIWMTLQGFAWKHLANGKAADAVYPDRHQSRFMAYDAVINGADGIMYWGTHTIAEPEFWDVLLDTARDLHAASGILVGESVADPMISAAPATIEFLHKRVDVGDGIASFVLVANTLGETVTADLRLPFADGQLQAYDEPLSGTTPRRQLRIVGGRLSEEFGPYHVRIYTDSRRLPPPPRALPPEPTQARTGRSLSEEARFRRDSEPYSGKASWIWHPGDSGKVNSSCVFRKRFELPSMPRNAVLTATADDEFSLRINGRLADADASWSRARRRDVTSLLTKGENLITVEARDGGVAPCGFLADLQIAFEGDLVLAVVSDASWRSALTPAPTTWQTRAFDDAGWPVVEVVAPYGQGPWRDRLVIEPPE